MQDLKKFFDVMHVVYVERVDIAAYQMKNVARNYFDKRKESTYEDATHPSLACFEEAFFGAFISSRTERGKDMGVPYTITRLPVFLGVRVEVNPTIFLCSLNG